MYLWRTKTIWRETGRGTRDSCDVTVCWVDCFATSLLMLSEHTCYQSTQGLKTPNKTKALAILEALLSFSSSFQERLTRKRVIPLMQFHKLLSTNQGLGSSNFTSVKSRNHPLIFMLSFIMLFHDQT